MNKPSVYKHNFKNGVLTISKGVTTVFDWSASIVLSNDSNGQRRFIRMKQHIFLTKKAALSYSKNLLESYKLL